MAEKKSWVMYESWIPLFESLPNDKAGELIKAICAYKNGKEDSEWTSDPVLDSIYQMIKKTLDSDAEKYAEVCKKRSDNALKANASKSKQKHANACKSIQKVASRGESDSDSESVSESDNVSPSETTPPTPHKRTQAALVGESDLSDPVKEKLMEWLAYKKERKDSYGERGLQSLISQVHRHEQESGRDAVINVIELSMSNGWKGIIWDKMDQPHARSGTQNPKIHNFNERQYDYEALERKLVQN